MEPESYGWSAEGGAGALGQGVLVYYPSQHCLLDHGQ